MLPCHSAPRSVHGEMQFLMLDGETVVPVHHVSGCPEHSQLDYSQAQLVILDYAGHLTLGGLCRVRNRFDGGPRNPEVGNFVGVRVYCSDEGKVDKIVTCLSSRYFGKHTLGKVTRIMDDQWLEVDLNPAFTSRPPHVCHKCSCEGLKTHA